MNWTEVWCVVADEGGYLSVMQLGPMLDQNKILLDQGKQGYAPISLGPGFEQARDTKREMIREIKAKGKEDGE